MPGVALIWDFIGKDNVSPALNRMSASADRASASIAKTETGILGFSKRTVAALGAIASVDVLGHFVKDAAQFQKSMLLVQTQAGATAKQVQQFSKSILELAPKVGTAPDQLSVSLYHAESALKKLGATGPQVMNTVKIAAEGAKVGMTDVEDTTNSLTAAMASGIVRYNQAGKAMGALNAIVGAGDMHFSDLNEALSTGLLVTMRTFGVSLNDTGGALALFGDNNIRGAEAATKLRMAVQDLSKPAAKADEYLSKINLSSAKLRATLQEKGLDATLHLLAQRLTEFGITGSKVGGFLEDAFTKKAGTGLAILITRLHQFDEARAQVQKGADGFGAAWAATTKTASFQLDRLGAMFQVAAIQIGTKLLPAVTSAAQWLGDHLPNALHELGQIVSPVAHLVGSALGGAFHLLMDVLRPVAHGLAAVGSWLAGHRTVFTSIAGAVIGMWAAFKLLTGVRFIVLGAISTINKLGAVVELAAMKIKAFGVANSLAVAGIGALVGVGVAVWQQMSEAAARSQAMIKADVDSLTATLNKQTGALTNATRAWTIHRLALSGTYDLAPKLGVSFETITQAALGNKDALETLSSASRAYFANSKGVIDTDKIKLAGILGLSWATGQAVHQQKQYIGAMQQARAATAQSTGAVRTQVKGTQYLGDAIRETGTAIRTTVSALHTHSAATNADRAATMLLKEQTDQLKTALSGVAGRLNNAADAIAWQQALNDLTTTIKGNKSAWDGHTAAALADRAAVIGDMQTIVQHAQQMQNNGKTTQQVTGYITRQYGELRQHAVEAGIDGQKVDNLARKLGAFPKSIKRHLNIDTSQALNALANVEVQVRNLGNGSFNLSSNGSSNRAGLAAGGIVDGPGTGTSDTAGVYALSKGEAVIPAKAVTKHIGLIHELIRAGRGLASGGLIGLASRWHDWNPQVMAAIAMAESGGRANAFNNNPSTGDLSYGELQINMIGSMGPARRREFGISNNNQLFDPATNFRAGHMIWRDQGYGAWSTYNSGAYRQFLGSDGAISNAAGGGGGSSASARASARASRQANLSSTAASAIGNIGSAPGGRKFEVSAVGIDRIRAQIAHAWDVLHTEMGKGLSSAATEAFKRELQGYTRLARRELRQLKNVIFGRDQRALDHAGAYGSHGDVVTAFRQMLHDAKDAGATARQINNLTQAEKGLLAIQTQRVKDQATLAKMQQQTANMVNYRQGITSTLTGAFDSTKYGSIEDLEAGFTSATGTNNRYTRDLHRLRRMDRGKSAGAKALRAYITQLQASGDTATLDTLGHASRGGLASLERYLLAYDKSVGAGGAQAVKDKYGESIAQQRKRDARERERIADLRGDIRTLGRVMAEVATRDIKIDIDGHEIAKVVTHSSELEHLLHRLENHVKYGRKKHP